MTELGCTVQSFGSYKFLDCEWSYQTPVAWCDRICHHLRTFWRKSKIESWLASQRNDAQIARGLPLLMTSKLVEDLHTACQSLDGWELSVMSGCVTSDAKWKSRDFCRFCNQFTCPSTFHLLWECQAFRHLRTFDPPACALQARLGWGPGGVSHVLRQMANVRQAAVKLRLSLDRNNPPPAPGGWTLGGAPLSGLGP